MACGPNAWILKSTLLEGPSVLALLLGVFLLAVGLIALRPSPGLLARMSAFAALIGLYVLAAIAYVRYDVYIWWCEEDHVIEWLSAHFLLAGWVLGLILLARLASRRRFSTTGAILTCGYFWGFWRELEWGQPFFGDKFVYTRNFFRLRAYLDPAYFDEFRQAMIPRAISPPLHDALGRRDRRCRFPRVAYRLPDSPPRNAPARP